MSESIKKYPIRAPSVGAGRRRSGFFLILVVLLFVGCEQGGGGGFTLQNPIPSPPGKVPPAKTEVPPEAPPGNQGENADDNTGDQNPVFVAGIPGELAVDEDRELVFPVTAVSPVGGGLSYYFQCPYACPEGMKIDAAGVVTWRPGFRGAGLYDVKFTAVDVSGNSVTSDLVRITVKNVNREPTIDEVVIVPDSPSSPRQLSCIVRKTDRDGDDLTTERVWTVNGEKMTSIKGLSISAINFKARDIIGCEGKVRDSQGASSEPKKSEDFTIPNNIPVITGLRIGRLADGSPDFVVGDSVGCFFTLSDGDGDPVSVVESSIVTSPDWRSLKQVTSGSEPISYKIGTPDGHKSLVCSVTVSDGYDRVSAKSAPILIRNSPPAIKNIQLFTDGGGTLLSGGRARCEASFSDPDGDIVFPKVTFYNGNLSRGAGVEAGTSGSVARRTYNLRSVYDVVSPFDADINGNTFTCVVELGDIYGASSRWESLSLTVGDSSPTIQFEIPSLASQSLVTGRTLIPTRLIARDNDGDLISFHLESSNCPVRGINLSVDSTGVVTSSPVPVPSGPHSDRDCVGSFYAKASGVETQRVNLNLLIKNHAPEIFCSDKEQVLPTAGENYLRQAVPGTGGTLLSGPGQSICLLYDQDDPDGTGLSYSFSVFPDGCGLASDPETGHPTAFDGSVIRTSYKIRGRMGLNACSSTVIASDGGLASNAEVYTLRPEIEFAIGDDFDFDTACYLTVYPEEGFPKFNGGLSYSQSLAPATQLTRGDVGAPSMAFPFYSPFVGERSVGGRINTYDLLAAIGSGLNTPSLTLTWIMRGYSAALSPPVRVRTVPKNYTVGLETITPATKTSAVRRPVLALGRDSSEGRQIAPSKSCLNDEEGACTGIRASISAGDEHACVLTPSGSVACWGSNSKRQLGSVVGEGYGNSAAPVTVTIAAPGSFVGDEAAVMVASGANHNCLVTRNGRARCWGDNRHGQLGYGMDDPLGVGEARTVLKAGGGGELTGVVAVAAGGRHSCALVVDGSVWCWGSNASGQLGEENVTLAETCGGTIKGTECRRNATMVKDLPLPGVETVGISAGGDATCATLEDGRVLCWGSGGKLQLGGGNSRTRWGVYHEIFGDGLGNDNTECDETEKSQPGVCALSLVNSLNSVWSLAMSDQNVCAISRGGRTDCWGLGDKGQLGNGLFSDFSEPFCSSPSLACFENKPVYDGATQAGAAVAPGGNHTCAVNRESRVVCFGANDKGQLGNGQATALPIVSRELVRDAAGQALDGIVALAAGKAFACAVRESPEGPHSVWCWGDGAKGQIGSDVSQSSGYSASARKVTDFATGPASAVCTQAFTLTPITPGG